jgi:hypothetical protein
MECAMLRSLVLSGAVLIACASPVLAQTTCVPPFAPVIPNGATASLEDIRRAKSEYEAFDTASNTYQECIVREIQIHKADAARRGKDLDQTRLDALRARGNANQREKERAGSEYNAAARAYREAHPSQ